MFSKVVVSGFLAVQALAQTYTGNPLGPNPNNKRGIVFMPNKAFPNDYLLWTKQGSPLTWYYNYDSTPSSQLASTNLDFVPMAWGSDQSVSFLSDVEKLLSSGKTVTHVLGFNEPDMPRKWGGSELSPSDAADIWRQSIEPLAAKGIKLGSPAVAGDPAGFTWYTNFTQACSDCTIDFIALHWYGPTSGMQRHLQQYNTAWPKLPIWLTEFADSNDTPASTATNFNQSLVYLDSAPYVERYSYFGAARANITSVGANAALIDDYGALTGIGEIYMADYQGSSGSPAPPSQPSPVTTTTTTKTTTTVKTTTTPVRTTTTSKTTTTTSKKTTTTSTKTTTTKTSKTTTTKPTTTTTTTTTKTPRTHHHTVKATAKRFMA